MIFHAFLLLFVISVTGQITSTKQEKIIDKKIFIFHHLSQCRRNEYYDLDYFSCIPCHTLQKNLRPTPEKFGCECSENSATIAIYDTSVRQPICMDICNKTEIEKTKKINNEICWKNVTTNLLEKKCKFKFVVKKQDSAAMQIIGLNSIANSQNISQFNCSYCDPKLNYQYQDYCISNTLLKGYLNYNAFWNFRNLKFIAFFCQSLHNATACNHLANMCVMSHYTFDKNSPCSVFLLAQGSDLAIKYSGVDEELQNIRPFLFYKKGKDTAKELSQTISTASYNLGDSINLFATVYSLDGSLLRWEDVKINHLNLCQMHSKGPSSIKFGTKYSNTECKFTLENIIDLANFHANQEFLNIFLNYTDNDVDAEILFQPVPVLIEDLLPENQHNKLEDWLLVKRFQMITAEKSHDIASLPKFLTKYDASYKKKQFRSIRFPERIEIHYNIKEQHFITIPVMKIRYRAIAISDNSSLEELYSFTLAIDFHYKTETNNHLFHNISLPILLFVALLLAILRVLNYRSRHPTQEYCDSVCTMEFLLFSISNISNALLCFYILLLVYNSIEYFSGAITSAIDENASDSLNILVYAALVLKIIYLSIHFWRIGHYDLFFFDWERPKGHESNHLVNSIKSNQEMSKKVRNFISENNVSAWRCFFIANEWIKLSAKQKTSTFIQGLLTLILFNIIERREYIPHNDSALKLFAIITVYAGTYLTQLLSRKFIFDQIFDCPLQKFIDMCSLANISVLTLLESSYGFYIHGRSPHCFSDTNMFSIISQMHHESQNMCGKRGLLSDSDQQTYIILPPTNLKIYFERLLMPLRKSSNLSQSHFQKELNNFEGTLERRSIAYNSVNRFFCAFIDHAIKDIDYIIKDRTFLENLFNCEFENYLTESRGTFYIDKKFSFSRLLLYGNHQEIFIIEILLLIAMIFLTANLIASIVIICILNKLFEIIFRQWIRQNLSEKTLIDERFLM